jgi:signal peptidase I
MSQDQRAAAPPRRRAQPRPVRRSRLGGILQGVFIALGLAGLVGGFLLIAVQYRPYAVPTDSMEPTVPAGTTVLAHSINGSQVGRGDIVVFRDPTWGDTPLVKRVVAVGGDTVACCDKQGRVTVDGTPLDEPYLDRDAANALGTSTFSAKVPAGRLFLLGDNRAVSEDSRFHLTELDGSVPESDVMGRVEGTVWPLARLGGTIARTSAFDALPGRDAGTHGPLAPAEYAMAGGGALVLVTAALGSLLGRTRQRRGARN